MNRSFTRGLFALLFISILNLSAQPAPRWWKGNLHTHTLWSDGDDFPEMVVDWYKSRGYDFLALSDHNVLQEGSLVAGRFKQDAHASRVAKISSTLWPELGRTDECQRNELRATQNALRVPRDVRSAQSFPADSERGNYGQVQPLAHSFDRFQCARTDRAARWRRHCADDAEQHRRGDGAVTAHWRADAPAHRTSELRLGHHGRGHDSIAGRKIF